MDPYGDMEGEFDILGDDEAQALLGELLGYSDYDILGAARRSPAASRLMQQRAAQRGAVVTRRSPSNVRRLGLPFDTGSTLIAAAAQATITVQPNVTIRPERLKVAPSCADAFRITSVAIGRRLQFAAGGSIHASLYSALNPNNQVQWDTADKREPIEMVVVNDSGAGARFMAELIGTVVE